MNTERSSIDVGDLHVDVVRKGIRNLHLGVYPPNGRVRVAAPSHLDDDAVRLAVLDKLDWIRRQQARFVRQARQTPREMVSGESHYYLGRRYLLRVTEGARPQRVEARSNKRLDLYVREGASTAQRVSVLAGFYRQELRHRVGTLIDKWAPEVGVVVDGWTIRRMKTRWGSCNPESGRVLFNLELAKKPPVCIEYVVVHELVHLVERHHTEQFTVLMSQQLPGWRHARQLLNVEPLAHETWSY